MTTPWKVTERDIGPGSLFQPKRKTSMFNGDDDLASLYAGTDPQRGFANGSSCRHRTGACTVPTPERNV